MGKVVYSLNTFNSSKAAAGEMCVMVPSDYDITVTANNPINYYTEAEFGGSSTDPNYNFLGLGICRLVQPNSYLFTVDSTTYTFNSKGEPASLNASGKKLVMGVLASAYDAGTKNRPVDVGDSTTVAGSRTVTRSPTQTTVNTDYSTDSSVTVSDLKARDHFANLAMMGMLEHISDPSTLSNNEISMYCQAAYKWAANMMREAANARTVRTTDSEASSEVPVADLDDNTEKLLFDIKNALQRTDDLVPSIMGTWKKAGEDDVPGAYTNEAAAGLGDYADIAAAEADGWSWTADSYDYYEKISLGGNSLGTAGHPFVVSTGSSGDETVHIGDTNAQSHPGYGESTTNPFRIAGKETGDALRIEVKNVTNNGSDVPLVITGDGTNGNLDVDATVSGGVAIANTSGGVLKIEGDNTYNDKTDVLNVAIVSGGGGGGGGGSTDVSGIVSALHGNTTDNVTTKLGNINDSLGDISSVAQSMMNYEPSGASPGSNAGDLIKVLYDIKLAIDNSGGGGGNFQRDDADAATAGDLPYINEVVCFGVYDHVGTNRPLKVALSDMAGTMLYSQLSEPNATQLNTMANSTTELIVYNTTIGSAPFKISTYQLAGLLPLKPSLVSFDGGNSGTITLNCADNTIYYYVDNNATYCQTLNIGLPTTSDSYVEFSVVFLPKRANPDGVFTLNITNQQDTIIRNVNKPSAFSWGTRYMVTFKFFGGLWVADWATLTS